MSSHVSVLKGDEGHSEGPRRPRIAFEKRIADPV